MINIDTKRIFKDNNYKELLIEYYNFVSYVLQNINKYTIKSSCVSINEDSVIYQNKEQFIEMLQTTFPDFEISFAKSDEYEYEDRYVITVSWKNIKY
jgi:hypothetical protein